MVRGPGLGNLLKQVVSPSENNLAPTSKKSPALAGERAQQVYMLGSGVHVEAK